METTFVSLNENENTELLDGLKDLLRESYGISEEEAILMIHQGYERVPKLLKDYAPYLDLIKNVSDGLSETLEKHLKQADYEDEKVLKMMNEAAAWYAFEYIRVLYKNKANIF
ncbi:hypothetical protein [Bacillus sp. 3255]|uniref:hypothetical protein n=1 Tax=Bacillus sp. 3255 TaxID=2817904 RepID=UPI002865FD2A|nr:hypothetical protein [Bacillus sp. 3255]MDR6882550.1 cobalamin biosynthesis protein CbiD [Bacillus sp. 3255]